MRVTTLFIATLAAALLAGCGSGGEASPGSEEGRSAGAETASPTASPTAGPTASPTPTSYVGGELGACFIPVTPARVRPAELRGEGLRLPGIVFAPGPDQGPAEDGSGRTVLILLHQTDGGGRCGWGPFGNAVAASGMTALAFDQCGYAGSDCSVPDPDDPLPQVQLALAFAREQLGATRVVLVGASMGGSRVVRAVAGGARVDAWADISGPSEFDGVALAPLASRITTPGLVALAADADGEDEAAAAQALAVASGATWVPAQGGHGYTLLTDEGDLLPLGQQVLDLARG
jgi:pimeloyl-ACP methyl ester carboxylesterase